MANVETVIQFALAQVGKPYVWGTEGPNSYDCSGLIWASYRHAGVKIGRVTYTQIKNGTAVSRSELRRGDLVFPDPGHVQLYLGNGTVVHSPHSGARVRINDLSRFYAGRRIIGSSTGSNVGVGLPTPGGISGTVGDIRDALSIVTNPHTYMRLFVFGLGVLLLALAVSTLIRPVAKEVVNATS